MLETLRNVKLFAKAEKCEFDCKEVEFLGYRTSPNGINMDARKVEAITNWKLPKTLKEVQRFLGFANFYWSFVKDYSKIAAPLTRLTRKDKPFGWNTDAEQAFTQLKRAFTTAPILANQALRI